MVYEAEVVLPPEVTMGSLRVQAYDEAVQGQLRHENIDLIDERRWQSAIKNAWYHQALKHYQEQFMHSRELQVDDLVLRRVLAQEGANKLSSGWKGPFHVTQVCRPGCVHLATEDGEPLHNRWNIKHLRKLYPWYSSETASSCICTVVPRSSAWNSLALVGSAPPVAQSKLLSSCIASLLL
jgi:hypothetical protein